MARIPDTEIERLTEEVSLQRFVEQAGVELRRQGTDLVGRCPFHEDRSPSLVLSSAKNLWHCLGACQAAGSVIDWVMRSRACRSGTRSSCCGRDRAELGEWPAGGALDGEQAALAAGAHGG